MNNLVAQWQQLLSRVDELELRQRGLLFFGIVVVLYVAWAHLLMDPLDVRREALTSQVSQTRADIDTLNAEIGRLARGRGQDPDAPLRERLGALRVEMEARNRRIGELTQSLIPPKEMVGVLESLLTRDTRLKLIALEGLGHTPLVEWVGPTDEENNGAVEPGQADGSVPGLYKHGLRLVFRGSYSDTVKLLEQMEGLPWNFIWSRMRIEIEEYPVSVVTLEIYSLSFDEAWLEV